MDYFLWAKPFLAYWGHLVAEAGLACAPAFCRLRRVALRAGGDLMSHRSLGLGSGDVLELQESAGAVRAATRQLLGGWTLRGLLAGGALAAAASPCVYRHWPSGVFACRDAAYVAAFGAEGRCEPRPSEEGCGLAAFNCCGPFWGFAEKLEYLTGRRWDLPCHCGLADVCEDLTAIYIYIYI